MNSASSDIARSSPVRRLTKRDGGRARVLRGYWEDVALERGQRRPRFARAAYSARARQGVRRRQASLALDQSELLRFVGDDFARGHDLRSLGTRPRDVLSGLTRRGLQQLFPVSRKHPEIGLKLAVARSSSAWGHSFSSIHAH
jgi:hypothetical protein